MHAVEVAAGNEQGAILFCGVFKKQHPIIGNVMVKNIDWSVPKGELAYFIDAEQEGKGFTSNAVELVKNYAFEDLKIEKLYIKIDPRNLGSKRVAINNGFEKEGYFKHEYRTGYGDVTDVERYGLVNNRSRR
ncbi:GNAT family N-acetyltransferase [Segetibacter aerophilus]